MSVSEGRLEDASLGTVIPAGITLFGFEPAVATVRIEARSRIWRLRRTLLAFGMGLVIAPFVALVPPHAPWAIGALALGALAARRRWTEHHSLLAVDGSCPGCGDRITLGSVGRLRHPHPLTCESCHHELALDVKL